MKIVAFCEALADFQIASDLVDRVLREAGPKWVADVMEAEPEGIRTYLDDGAGRSFFDLHKLDGYAKRVQARVPHGHFDGRPGAAGALMARTAFSIVRRLSKTDTAIDAVILIWDMDDQPASRREGLGQARNEAQHWTTPRIVLGCLNAMREAWVLVGFDPSEPEEEARLADLRRELGFSPVADAHLLDSNDEQAKRSPKRVLRILTLDDRDRERHCWMETPLETLRARGAATGLTDFLGEVKQHLVPLCSGPPAATSPR